MSKMKISPRGSSWDDFERQMYTPEEIEASKVRSEIITEMIKAREEGGVTQKQLEIMSGIKQKNRVRQQRKRVQQHKRSMLGISAVIMLLVMVVSVSSISLQARNKEYIAQEKELEASIQEEKDRAEEISELEDYVGTDEYIEQTAKDKLGLFHENEIIFKAR
mgnify:CR=1 FL=1